MSKNNISITPLEDILKEMEKEGCSLDFTEEELEDKIFRLKQIISLIQII